MRQPWWLHEHNVTGVTVKWKWYHSSHEAIAAAWLWVSTILRNVGDRWWCVYTLYSSFLRYRLPSILILLVSPLPLSFSWFAVVNSKQLSSRSRETKRGLHECQCIIPMQLLFLATVTAMVPGSKWPIGSRVTSLFVGGVVCGVCLLYVTIWSLEGGLSLLVDP